MSNSFEPMKPFRFWCQKVLPLVYDDSLSYYELLCKVVDYLNNEAGKINNIAETLEQLTSYLNNYFTAPDEMRFNIAYAVDGKLTSENFKEAFESAINSYKYLYIPKGNYNFDTIGKITVSNKNLDILLDDAAVLYQEESTDGMFLFNNCSINWNGGILRSGTSQLSHDMLYKSSDQGGNGLLESALYFNECHDCHIINLVSEYSKLPGVILLYDTQRVKIDFCRFDYSVESAIRIFDHCVDTVVDSCQFNHIYIPNNPDGITYCYAVASGIHSLSALNVVPADILTYTNNVVIGSEDSGLDTHGATNVIIANNTIIDCSTAITAYNDNRRVKRPAGWRMKNILIENNVCDSNYTDPTTGHPYILLGSANRHKSTEEGYENNPGNFDAYQNLVFRNNYIASPSVHVEGIVALNQVTRDVIIENNIIDGKGSSTNPLILIHCIDYALRNNSIQNNSGYVSLRHSLGTIDNNIGMRIVNGAGINYCKGLDAGDVFTGTPQTVRSGDIIYSAGDQKLCTNFGIRARLSLLPEAVNQQFSITVADGIAAVEDNQMIPGLVLSLTGDIPAYVKQLIDFESFTIVGTDGQPIADGTYTATILDATFATLYDHTA